MRPVIAGLRKRREWLLVRRGRNRNSMAIGRAKMTAEEYVALWTALLVLKVIELCALFLWNGLLVIVGLIRSLLLWSCKPLLVLRSIDFMVDETIDEAASGRNRAEWLRRQANVASVANEQRLRHPDRRWSCCGVQRQCSRLHIDKRSRSSEGTR